MPDDQSVTNPVVSDAERLMDMGRERQAHEDWDGAINCYMGSLRIEPKQPKALYNLGVSLAAKGMQHVACAHFEKSVYLDESDPDILHALARCYSILERHDEAIGVIDHALKLAGEKAAILHSAALMHHCHNRLDVALNLYDRALAAEHDEALDIKIRWDRSLCLLTAGHYIEGWKDHDARFDWVDGHAYIRKIPLPLWNGEPLAGKTLWLYTDQGLGDLIMAWRFVRRLYDGLPNNQPGRIIFDVNPEEYRLISREVLGWYGIELRTKGSVMPAADYHLPLMSLPGRLGATLEGVNGLPYLRIPEPPSGPSLPFRGGLRAGLMWAGSSTNPTDHRRSIPLGELMTLFALPHIEWYSFQQGQAESLLQPMGLNGLVTGIGPLCRDFSETAGYLDQMDVVVSVDTAIVHLAGALGIPCFMMAAYDSDWRWGRELETTPWYDSVRIFRQADPGKWSQPVEGVKRALMELKPRR